MQLEVLFHRLLGLGEEWEVTQLAVREEDGTVEIRIRECPALWRSQRCGQDGAALRSYDHGEERRWRHLNIFQYRCEIISRLPRGRCPQCGKVMTLPAPWEGLSKGFTLAFEAMCLLLARDMPVRRVAQFVGEHDTRLWRVLLRHVDTARSKKNMSGVRAIACEELSIRKGHVYATVFADALKREVLYATPTREDLTWWRFAQDLTAHGGDPLQIRHASIDMSKAYQSGARLFTPHAQLVFDKFHVIKLANDALDAVRRAEMKHLDAHTVQMKRSRYVWLKNPERLSEGQQRTLDTLTKLYLQTGRAYQMRLSLQEIYRTPDSLRARRRFRAWIRWTKMAATKNPLLAPMARVGRTLQKHLQGILAHWETHMTNAFMEGLMSVFSAVKRKARGYRSFSYLKAMPYFTGSNLDIPTRPLFHVK